MSSKKVGPSLLWLFQCSQDVLVALDRLEFYTHSFSIIIASVYFHSQTVLL